jgi:hypothetical protein
MPRIWAIIEVNKLTGDYQIVHLASHDLIAGYVKKAEMEYSE